MPQELSIAGVIRHFGHSRPDQLALVEDGPATPLTWAEVDARSNRLARAYAEVGVEQDSMVGVALPNSAEFFVACAAIWKLGATPMPLSPKLPAPERQRIVDLTKPALLIGIDPAPGSGGVEPGPGSAESVPVAGSPAPAGTEPAVSPPTLPVGFEPETSADPLPDRAPTYWKALTSGGSTGTPKLIVAREPMLLDPAVPPVDYIPADGRHLVAGPLYHNAAFIYAMRGWFCGNRLVIMRRFDPARALHLLVGHRISWVQLVPTMMSRIWKLGDEARAAADLSQLQTVLHVGGPCAPWLKRAWIDWLGPDVITEVYAGTEAQGATMITGREWLEHPGSVGRPIRDSRFEVQDEHGNVVPPGVVGEVFLMPAEGPGSTYHYLGAEPRSRDGWESLGDLGHYDEDGYLYLDDRSTDCIVTGAANVYPAEVEGALDSYPGVRSSAVIGLPDDDLGMRVIAIVEADEGVTAEALDTHVATLLAPYKRPRGYEFSKEPLRDEAGKVRRSALRAARLRTV